MKLLCGRIITHRHQCHCYSKQRSFDAWCISVDQNLVSSGSVWSDGVRAWASVRCLPILRRLFRDAGNRPKSRYPSVAFFSYGCLLRLVYCIAIVFFSSSTINSRPASVHFDAILRPLQKQKGWRIFLKHSVVILHKYVCLYAAVLNIKNCCHHLCSSYSLYWNRRSHTSGRIRYYRCFLNLLLST